MFRSVPGIRYHLTHYHVNTSGKEQTSDKVQAIDEVRAPKINFAELRAQLEAKGEIHCPEQVCVYRRGCGCS